MYLYGQQFEMEVVLSTLTDVGSKTIRFGQLELGDRLSKFNEFVLCMEFAVISSSLIEFSLNKTHSKRNNIEEIDGATEGTFKHDC